MISHRPIRIALAVLCAALSLPACAQSPVVASLNPMAAMSESAFGHFVDAPLFEPTRRSPLAPVILDTSLPVVHVEQPPVVQLIGLIEGPEILAIVRNGAQSVTVRTGDRVEGWTAEVLPQGLRLRSGLRAFDYALFQDRGHAGPTAVEGGPSIAAAQPMSALPQPVRTGN